MLLQEVISRSQSTLLVCDAELSCLQRLWCLYEVWATLLAKGLPGVTLVTPQVGLLGWWWWWRRCSVYCTCVHVRYACIGNKDGWG